MSSQTVDLAGTWSLRDQTGAHPVPMAVPGDGISALVAAGELPEPYWGRNEYDCRWVSERNWVVSRTFDVASTDMELVLDQLDTVAQVRINDVVMLDAENMHRRFRIDVSDVLSSGQNTIDITFFSPVEAGNQKQASLPFFVPYHAENSPIPNGNMLRKPQCDFGWDWNIALAAFGLYGGIALVPKRDVRVGDILVDQAISERLAHVDVSVSLPGARDGDPVEISLCGQTQDAAVQGRRAIVSFDIEDPELWWPVGLGPQTLHGLKVRCAGAERTIQIGLRDLELVSENDEIGRSFLFRVNGRDVFARGANWIPADALGGRIEREAVRDLLQSAVDANMNMIRVWGGGRYEPDWFYDLCDQMGLMVWQDFMFACNLYPSSSEFLAEVDREARDVLGRLGHHACIAVWCGDNELIGALNWFEESRQDRDRYLVSYDRLNRILETAVDDVAPRANWWPSSPSPGPFSFGDAWHDDSSGDMHFWSVWHEGRDFDHYRDVEPRFCSEFGFQSYPSMNVVKRFADPEDWNIASPVMESHQKNAGGNARIAETMFRYFRFPNSFEDFVYLSQVQQGVAIKTAVDGWRAAKPRSMGTLIWQLNDTWPVASWSSLDYGGGWKLLHHMAKDFYEPLNIVATYDSETVSLVGVNDGAAPVDLKLSVSALKMDGEIRNLETINAALSTDAARGLFDLPKANLAADEILIWNWKSAVGTGSDFWNPRPFKSYDLPRPGIQMRVNPHDDHWHLELGSSRPAFFVSVEADVPGRFSDNAVLLLPGQSRDIVFRPQEAGVSPQFVVRDLHSATCSQLDAG